MFTMGPSGAEQVLREAFARGADYGCLICDSAFAGSDVLATSYTLMQAIRSQGEFELILCGRQTTDGDTAQVSGELAEWMGLPHCNWVCQIESAEKDGIVFWQQTERVKRKLFQHLSLSVVCGKRQCDSSYAFVETSDGQPKKRDH